MRYGVIDIGTNTIRGVAYEISDKNVIRVEDKLVRSHILFETANSKLSENGINRLVVVLNKLSYVLKNAGCEKIGCFATSSLRELKNKEDVAKIVEETTSVSIDLLSGEEEAECDFFALRKVIAERAAIGVDLGGGSAQIVQFDRNELFCASSFNIGSRRIKMQFLSDIFPTEQERKKIDFYVKNQISDIKNEYGVRYIYATGGSAKSALKLYSALTDRENKENFLSIDMIDSLIAFTDKDPDKMYGLYSQIVKNYSDTVITGLTVLRSICKNLDTNGFYVVDCSVRDGYLIKMVNENR